MSTPHTTDQDATATTVPAAASALALRVDEERVILTGDNEIEKINLAREAVIRRQGDGGKYKVLERKRDTILGAIFMCLTKLTGAPVAIKVSSIARMRSGQYTENGREEASWLLYLQREGAVGPIEHVSARHPSLLPLLDFWSDRQNFCVVFPWCTGGDLLEYVLNHGRSSEVHARGMFRQLVDGVAHMHGKNVCHLDLSAENVMLPEMPANSEAAPGLQIIDFGLARYCPVGSVIPGNPHYGGKVGYKSPEMFHGQVFDPRAADIYALGVILFLVATGQAPYNQEPRTGGPRYADSGFLMIHQGRVSELLTHWGFALSAELRDLLQRLLNPQRTRISMIDILRHPWLVNEPINDDDVVDDDDDDDDDNDDDMDDYVNV